MNKLLVIGFVWPEPSTTAAGNRMLQLLELFLAHGYHITFASTAAKTAYSEDLTKLGISEQPILLNDASFNAFVADLQPHVVVYDRFMVEEQFGWRVTEVCPQALTLLNTEDLHSLRDYRAHCFKKQIDFTQSDWLQQDKTKRELTSIFRCDLTLLVSTFEIELLTRVGIPKNLLYHLPFLLPEITETTQHQWPSFEQRQHFICYGNGKHQPNVDAYNYLKTHIWPLIRQHLPTAELHIYGAYLPQQVVEMHKPTNGFLVKGWVKDLKSNVQQARVVLAPLRFGAGIKGKLTLAMQAGTPSVTTPLGAEGMFAVLPWAGNLANSPEDLAKSAVHLYTHQNSWLVAQQRGIELIHQHYNKGILQALFLEKLTTLQHELPTHRTQNLVGQLLQHQSLAATKFMGKWIEAKNTLP
ncbi:glycosyl transferase [Croceivirga lutea]|uniref:glycosyltransferase n=1 Tax=Croceivirga lutea TaxID=1775167 RepID=UPI00163B1BB1|nr:glycosyltransferase [Croceivirga lutea]GGG44875.1 glycosyl transferase [Croceivirga lutea]